MGNVIVCVATKTECIERGHRNNPATSNCRNHVSTSLRRLFAETKVNERYGDVMPTMLWPWEISGSFCLRLYLPAMKRTAFPTALSPQVPCGSRSRLRLLEGESVDHYPL